MTAIQRCLSKVKQTLFSTANGNGAEAFEELKGGPPPDTRLQHLIDLVRSAKGQLSQVEYGFVMGLVSRQAPCNLLVFGLGRDSELWAHLNAGGRTVFLEDVEKWFRQVEGAECHLVKYPGLVVPEAVAAHRWDVVLVDAPWGWRPIDPGREESIRASAQLCASGGAICVHDYNREAEQRHATKYLGEPTLAFDRMAFFRR